MIRSKDGINIIHFVVGVHYVNPIIHVIENTFQFACFQPQPF